MGFFDRIKDTYKKVDDKLGGYLPGGRTPREVKDSRKPVDPVVVPPRNSPSTGGEIAQSTPNPSTSTGNSGGSSRGFTRVGSPEADAQIKAFQDSQVSEYTDGQGTFTANPNPQNRVQRAVGEFTTGLLNKEDPGNRDLTTQEPLTQLGRLTNYVGNMALLGVGGAGGAAANSFKTGNLLSKAQAIVNKLTAIAGKYGTKGQAIASGTELFQVGKVVNGGKALKNTAEAKRVSQIFTQTAQAISPSNWRSLLGWGSTVTGVGLATYFSYSGTQNAIQDDLQQLSIGASKLLQLGDIEGAKELREMMGEMIEFQGSIQSKIPVYNYFASTALEFKHFIDKTDKEIDATEEAATQQEITLEMQRRIVDGTATPEEIQEYQDENPDKFQLQDDLQNAQENAVDTDRLAFGQELADRILRERPTAEELLNDAEIRAFALDPNNQFSAVTKLYNEAIAATGRGSFFGSGEGGNTKQEAPSTLNFGLLSTGGETVTESDEEPLVPGQQSLEDLAMETFGVPYAQLTEVQKATLQ